MNVFAWGEVACLNFSIFMSTVCLHVKNYYPYHRYLFLIHWIKILNLCLYISGKIIITFFEHTQKIFSNFTYTYNNKIKYSNLRSICSWWKVRFSSPFWNYNNVHEYIWLYVMHHYNEDCHIFFINNTQGK